MARTRVTVTIDDSLVEAAKEQAAGGSLSAWVADAMASKMRTAAKLQAMQDALTAYEAEFGPISDEDATLQLAEDRANAIRVRRGPVVGSAS